MAEARITSRDNPLLVRVRKLTREPLAYRKLGAAWVEGEHLCSALRDRAGAASHALCAESAWARAEMQSLARYAMQVAVLPDRLFADLSTLPSPAGIGFVCSVPQAATLDPNAATVVLDRLQDAGNVGSILRSASALGVRQIIALRGTAGLWSPKVLRAGMGAQFALRLIEGADAPVLDALAVPLVATSSHGALALPQAALPARCAWVFGHEGQGVADDLLGRCALTVTIPQPGGEESLNVAAAAAICLYESLRRSVQGAQ